MEKEVVKSQNRTKVFVAFIGLVGVCIGTFGMKWYNDNFGQEIVVEKNMAHVQNHNGLYIFFRSTPISGTYESMGSINTNSIFRAIENTQGKKKFGDILKSIGNSVVQEHSFEKRLSLVVDKVSEQYSDADGLIFQRDLTQCEIIKFK